MKSVTNIYTVPEATDDEQGRARVVDALEKLSAELELADPVRLKSGHRARIKIPNVEPDDTWAAMARAVPAWPELFLPRPAD